VGHRKGAYRVLVGRPGGKRLLGKPRPRWEDDIKMELQEMEWEGMVWIDLAQERDRGLAVVNEAVTFGFHKIRGIS
jgi:hypothetical protein